MTDNDNASVPAAPPGWYPVDGGQRRWWDGTQWTEHTAPAEAVRTGGGDDVTLSALVHALAIFSEFIGPLVIYLVKRDSAVVRHHAAEALNFSITVMIGYVVSVILTPVLIGIPMLFAVWIGSLVLRITAAVAASKAELYRYPINIRLVS
jgi:uncharacterized Tic20 family protein